VSKKQDTLYASPLDEIIDFKFDERVVSVFPDMIQRSVPGYSTLISTIGVLAGRYAQDNSICYDLGCSLGAVSLSMQERIKASFCRIEAIDNSPEMIEKGLALLSSKAASTPPTVPIHMTCMDIDDKPIIDASVVVMNFTLQFIPAPERAALIQRIYDGLKPGGVFILSEKVAFEDIEQQSLLFETHHDFKRDNGYSDLDRNDCLSSSTLK